MRIFIFLLSSVLLHLILLSCFYFAFDEVSIVNKNQSLSVVLLNEKIYDYQGVIKKLGDYEEYKPIILNKEPVSNTEEVDTSPESQIQPDPVDVNQNQQLQAIELKDFYSNSDVDRKALPQMNIDQSMLASEDYSGLPIKLRLYINNFGRVVKVEPIAVLDQDLDFVEKLTNLLYKIRFLPAKRESLDVDSYQDLQLSFDPIAIPSTSHIEREKN